MIVVLCLKLLQKMVKKQETSRASQQTFVTFVYFVFNALKTKSPRRHGQPYH